MPAFLPILMLDEHRLAPSFGYVFHADWHNPHESIVTLLWKYVRGNAIAGHVVVAEIARDAIDPYEGIEAYREAVHILRLKMALGLSRRILNLKTVVNRFHLHDVRANGLIVAGQFRRQPV